MRAESVSIREGGCGPVRADARSTIGAEGVARLVVADEVTVEPGGVVQPQVPADAARWAGTGAIVGLLGRRASLARRR